MRLFAQASNRRRAAGAKSHGRPVGKPLRHPVWVSGRETIAGIRLCESNRKEGFMLSGPRRAQAGSHLPKASARDQRSGSASELTGPRGDVASHFVGRLVLCIPPSPRAG